MALLGEKIAQSMFNTAPEPDPENVFDDDTIAKSEFIDTGIDVEINLSRLRDIDLGDAYAGKVISRKELNEWSNDDIDIDVNSDDNDNISDEDSDMDDDEIQQLRVIPEVESSDNEMEEEFDTLFEDEDEQTAGLITDNTMNKNEFNEFSSMMNKQMDKAEKLQQTQMIMDKSDIKPQSFQLRKAKAVAAQTKLYDKVATLRIHLQKPFLMAQKLPRPSVHCELIEDVNNKNQSEQRKKLKRLFSEVSDKSLELADKIMSLQSQLLDKNDDYPDELRYRKRKRLNDNNNGKNNEITFEELWNEQNEDWSDFIPYCNKTMESWDKKMRLVEDYSAKKAKNKHKNNQSLLERIALIIENPQRILYKMQSVDKLFKMYGDKNGELEDVKQEINDEDDGKRLKFEKYRMEYETFNDSQFYRRMLKEIIDIGHTASLNTEDVHRKMDQIQYEKQKQKMAFHKAKLRMKYTIRPDMENFMAPIYNHDPDFPAEQLYKSLFQ